MLNKLRRKIKNKITNSIRDHYFSIKQIPKKLVIRLSAIL